MSKYYLWQHNHEPSGVNGHIKTEKVHGLTVTCISAEHSLWRVNDHPKLQGTYRWDQLDYMIFAQLQKDKYLR